MIKIYVVLQDVIDLAGNISRDHTEICRCLNEKFEVVRIMRIRRQIKKGN